MAATAAIKGLDLLISIGAQTLGGQRGATLNRSSEVIDITNKVSGGWKENVSGFKEWSVDADGLFITDDAAYLALETAYAAGTAVEVKLAKGAELVYSGSAYITDFPVEAPYDDASTYSVSLTGTG